MLKINYIKAAFFTALLTIALTAQISMTVLAANDDPGAGRLSGKNIPEEFYDTEEEAPSRYNRSSLRRYGSSQTADSYTKQTYIHADALDGRTILTGIDVSQWQGNIDWARVKASGIDYAFIRVGYRGYGSAGTLNASTKDTYFDTNMQGAIDAGIHVGVYIFSQAITVAEAQEEARYLLDYLGTYNVTLPLVMDYEYASDSPTGGRIKTAKLSKAQATEICMAFCDTIAEAGYTPMVYANKSMLEDQMNPADLTAKGYRIWLANYTTQTQYGGTYDFWQYSSKGTVDGISGNVDMNYYYVQDSDHFIPGFTPINEAQVTPIPDQDYTGAAITPPLTVMWQGRNLILNQDYTISYHNNLQAGEAMVKLHGMGQFGGTKTVTFRIVAKAVSGLKAKKRTTTYITLSWNKEAGCSGYQLYRSASLNGTYKKIATIKKASTTSYKNTKLTAGQCYYYKIRSYKTTGGNTVYGEFSEPAALYTKSEHTRNATAKKGAKIYTTALTDSNIIASPAKGDTMSVTYYTKDDSGSGWYHVVYKSGGETHNGFIPAGKVSITMVGKVVKTKTVNVRKSSSVSSKKLTTLKKNKKVTVLTTKKKKGVTWYKVTFKKSGKTYTGWIAAPYLKLQ